MTLAAAGAAFLNAAMKEAAGVTVTYQPKEGVNLSKPLTVWTGTPGLDEAARPDGAARVVGRERDYLVLLADLTELTGGRLPQEGDRVTETIGGREYAFVVSKRGNEPCWRWSDRERTRLRVHVKPAGAC